MDDYDFYLCGPGVLTQSLHDALRSINVPANRIRYETFGPASPIKTPPSNGLNPVFSCRAGVCGTCSTRVLEGKVKYAVVPATDVPADEALIRCALPAAGGARVVLDL